MSNESFTFAMLPQTRIGRPVLKEIVAESSRDPGRQVQAL